MPGVDVFCTTTPNSVVLYCHGAIFRVLSHGISDMTVEATINEGTIIPDIQFSEKMTKLDL